MRLNFGRIFGWFFVSFLRVFSRYLPSGNHGCRQIDEDGKGDERHRQRQANVHYTQHNFLDPLKLVSRLSGYPQLVGLYRILVTLPVTSCSAERSFSKLRIVKNRLRSSMCDEWLKCLMILAAEKDILSRLKNDDIIDQFAETSDDLAQVLRCL
jgi:hypothetical protein